MARLQQAMAVAFVTTVVMWSGLLWSGARPAGATALGTISGGSPEAVVVVGGSGTIASWWGGSGARWTCRYLPIEAPFGNTTESGNTTVGVTPVEGTAYVLNCDDQNGQLVDSRLVIYQSADPLGGVAVVARTVDEARRRIDLADPVPAANPAGDALVGLPTWLGWTDQWATASIGDVSATVHAVPVAVEWNTGDGGYLLCDQGTPYDLSRPARAQISSCTHTFQNSTTRRWPGFHTMVATQRWIVWWNASTGESGDLGFLFRSATRPIRVIEAQALVR